MKVLIVHSGNSNFISPFVSDQVEALNAIGVITDYFLIQGNGPLGYLKNLSRFIGVIKQFKPDIVHAHNGLSGFLAILQRSVPVVTTFHGSDINNIRNRIFSRFADKLSHDSIFVSDKLARLINRKNANIVPCGVNIDLFHPIAKHTARERLGLPINEKFILFPSTFNNPVKNFQLADSAIQLEKRIKLNIIELKGYKREDVAYLINAVDVVLLTSISEGSPQSIKEAMACNTPIVSTDVGDVRPLISGTEGCFVVESDPAKLREKLLNALMFEKTNVRF
jgi:teichuronic acid biosynthesis glycosyltransferase TuaC